MESYCDSWYSYRKTFPPPFVCSSPECALLCTTHRASHPQETEKGNESCSPGETEKVPEAAFNQSCPIWPFKIRPIFASGKKVIFDNLFTMKYVSVKDKIINKTDYIYIFQ